MTRLPVIGITMGDPAGIGPELAVKALVLHPEIREWCTPIVLGDRARLEQAATVSLLSLDLRVVRTDEIAALGDDETNSVVCVDFANVRPTLPFGELSAEAGEAAYQYVLGAVALAQSKTIDAVCTLPLNKAALHAAGHPYPGHSELLADLTATSEISMMLDTGTFCVVHVTTHLGLLDAIKLIEPDLVYRTIVRAHDALCARGIASPTLAVCGINPHAGEGGLFGNGEEEEKVEPAIARARAEGIIVEGPLPADTVFFRAQRSDFDAVIAMYHDQGHGPVKVLGLDKGVNVTLGLPIVRTSVDHGTAFDIAGTGVADEGSLLSALRVAAALSGRGGTGT